MTNTNHRVAQWATGNIGLKALRGIIEHPSMTLAGVHVYDPNKVGRDAGELCGLDPVGVAATGKLEDVLATNADCVLYMPRVFDLDDVCRLLESGSNVVATCGVFHHPPSMDPAVRDRVEAACRTGGTSVHSTGSSPGFISEAVPLVLTSIQRRLDKIIIDEYADLSRRNSPEMLFDLMGFGRDLAPFEQFRADYLGASFGPSLRLIADAVGLPLDEVVASGELATTPRELTIAAGTQKAGSVAGQRITITGLREGRELITFRATWYTTTDLDATWELGDTGWHIDIQGDAPLDVTLRMPISLEQMAETTPAYTANRAVNLVEAVCAAPPGIRSVLELPLSTPTFG
ncbi:NAD(P)H-dependent amine dehydrogenase family protein [Nocardia noduli]|uniref:NAD(P)H-dependent amine dehydrogenase family protein n=1 Tax=Nocardia noduli TaxID=2815722 RepID=UPI001C241196|nr:dihydrodipicolinate reductase [Nocardia noduli]